VPVWNVFLAFVFELYYDTRRQAVKADWTVTKEDSLHQARQNPPPPLFAGRGGGASIVAREGICVFEEKYNLRYASWTVHQDGWLTAIL
jgi:hypothetical protein